MLWPSAYGGGLPLNGYAMIHNYNIVAVGNGNMIDIFGRPISTESVAPRQYVATVDLDMTIVHKDFNSEKVNALLREAAGGVEVVPGIGQAENWFVLRAVKPGVRVRELCVKHELETLRQYRQNSRTEILERLKAGQPIKTPRKLHKPELPPVSQRPNRSVVRLHQAKTPASRTRWPAGVLSSWKNCSHCGGCRTYVTWAFRPRCTGKMPVSQWGRTYFLPSYPGFGFPFSSSLSHDQSKPRATRSR